MMYKKAIKSQQHEFAFYYHDLSQVLTRDIDMIIPCNELYHRLKHVVRMKADDTCVLFNQKERITFTFGSFEGRNTVVGTWKNHQVNEQLDPEITFVLPLLKIDALSDAVYSLAEVGVTNIQLVSTQKTQTPCNDKLLDKLHRVAVAAAEQSKMYAFPRILPAVDLADWLSVERPGLKYHFDVTGDFVTSWFQPVQKDQHYYLLVGPEGDLIESEKAMVVKAGFQSCLLTKTVLRSVRVVSLVSGMFRL